MSISSKLKAIDAKLDRQYLDLVNRIDSFSELLEVVRDDSLPAIENQIQSLRYEPNESRAEKLSRDIEDDLRIVGRIVLTMQKRTNDLIRRVEAVEISANGTYTYKYRDADLHLYQAIDYRAIESIKNSEVKGDGL